MRGRFIRRPSGHFDDLAGRKFGRLTVVRIAGYKKEKSGTHVLWLCRCRCKRRVVTIGRDMKRGMTQSCGCLQRQRVREHNEVLVRHGHTRTHSDGQRTTATYRSWRSMKGRCLNPNNPAYLRYGGAGVKVTRRWLGKKGFIRFLHEMGLRPNNTTLGRLMDLGNYCKSRCRWMTWTQQAAEAKKRRHAEAACQPD
jgi:hypothetical protein